jgi:hypothetical protein
MLSIHKIGGSLSGHQEDLWWSLVLKWSDTCWRRSSHVFIHTPQNPQCNLGSWSGSVAAG